MTNLEPAGGGAVQESLAQVQARAPQQLRHRDRAVAAQDFVDLAFAASPDVARARAVTPQFEPLGTDKTQSLWVGENALSEEQLARHAELRSHALQVIIVPHSPDLQPVPSLGLMNQVETYLQQRCLPSVAVAVRGPHWIEVRVTATLAVASLEGSDAIRSEVISQLNRFLHCLTGGRDGRGWDFGRRPHASDFYALLESVPGVAWVQTLAFSPEADEFDDLGAFLIYPGPHTITLDIPQGGT